MTSITTITPIELVFKEVDGLQIFMDVYIPETATAENPAPVILWWHGGGLLQGTRKGLAPHHQDAPSKHGIAVVSADYRLAPQTRLPSILSDCADALNFLRTSPEFRSATHGRVSTSKIFLSGSSAGGFVTLLTGTGIGFKASGLDIPSKDGILGLIPIYPITDLEDKFWNTKQRPVSYMGGKIIEDEEVKEFVNPKAPKTAGSAEGSPRWIFYSYMVQEAILASLLLDDTNISPSEYNVATNIRSGNAPHVPPVYITHGTIDDKVPPSQSIDVVEALKSKNLPVKFDLLEGLDHLYDKTIEGYEMKEMYEWIKSQL